MNVDVVAKVLIHAVAIMLILIGIYHFTGIYGVLIFIGYVLRYE